MSGFEEVRTDRGSAGLVRGRDERCRTDEISGKGRGKGEHGGKGRFGSKGGLGSKGVVEDERLHETGAGDSHS